MSPIAQKLTRAGILRAALVVGALATGVGGASDQASHLAVSVAVGPRVVLEDVSQPASLEVTARDVARGYVDAPLPTRLLVTSNALRGVAIDVWPASEVFSGGSLIGGSAVADVGRDGGTIVARDFRGASRPLTLRWRFALARGVLPGTYAWPVHYAVRPLGTDR